jgi:hypothetical protein
MRSKFALITGSAFVAIIVAVIWLVLHQDRFQEIQNFYSNRSEAIKSSWIPDFLPISAINIHEKHNYDYNRVIVCFDFDAADVLLLLKDASEVSNEELHKRGPTWITVKEDWIPSELVEDNLASLIRDGSKVYEMGSKSGKRISEGRIVKWFLIVYPDKRRACAWS